MINLFLFVLIFLGINASLQGATKSSLIKPNSHPTAIAYQWSCSTFVNLQHAAKCNPALFSFEKSQKISFNLLGKAEGDSIETGKDLVFDPIGREDLENLFEEQSFNSFSFLGFIELKSHFFHLSYQPLFLIADLYFFNPAFPQVSTYVLNQQELRLTSGYNFTPFLPWDDWILSAGISAASRTRKLSQQTISLFDLALGEEDVLRFEEEKEIIADTGILLANDFYWIPDVSLQARNLGSKRNFNPSQVVSAEAIENIALIEPYTQLGLGKSLPVQIGEINLGTEFFFKDFYNEHYSELVTGSLGYNLYFFETVLGISKFRESLAFLFHSDIFSLSIITAREQELGFLNTQKNNSVYIGVEIGT